MTESQLDRVCCNCNSFFPDTVDDATEFGICLADEAFEPFIDEILNNNLACCQELIQTKRFSNDNEACENFDLVEYIEEDSELGREIADLAQSGELDAESVQFAVWKQGIKNCDADSAPIQNAVKRLRVSTLEEKKAGVSELASLAMFGNRPAREVLFDYFVTLPSPKDIEQVHHKKFVFDRLKEANRDDLKSLVKPLICELQHTQSNNTTRQWIDEILRYLSRFPEKQTRTAFAQILLDKTRSHKFKRKIRDIMDRWEFDGYNRDA